MPTRFMLTISVFVCISVFGHAEDWIALPPVKTDYGSGGLMWKIFIDADSVLLKSGREAQYWTKAVWTQAGKDDYRARTAEFKGLCPAAPSNNCA